MNERIDYFDDAGDARAEANRRATETGEDQHVYSHMSHFAGTHSYWVTDTPQEEGRYNTRIYSVSGQGIEAFQVGSPDGQKTYLLRQTQKDSDIYLRLDDGGFYHDYDEDNGHAEEGDTVTALIETLAKQYGMKVDLHYWQYTRVKKLNDSEYVEDLDHPEAFLYTYTLWLNDTEVVSGAVNPYEAMIALPRHIEDVITEHLLT